MGTTKLEGSFGEAQLLDPTVGQRFADAVNGREFDAAASLLTDDGAWHVEGDPAYAGTYTGPVDVRGLLVRLAEAELIGAILDVCVSDVHYVLMGAGWPSGKGEWIAHADGDKLGDTYLAV